MSEVNKHMDLIITLNDRFPTLAYEYDLTINHSGGGCFHIDMPLGKNTNVQINPINKDIIYDVPKSVHDNCKFTITDKDQNETNFEAGFEKGLKRCLKIKQEKNI